MYDHAMVGADVRVGIVGASGFTGAELLRIAERHPNFEVIVATGDSMAGRRAADLYPSLHGAYPDLVFTEFDPESVDGLDLVFLGLPHEASMELAPSLVGAVGGADGNRDRADGRAVPLHREEGPVLMVDPHAHVVRCPPGGRVVPFGRPGGH